MIYSIQAGKLKESPAEFAGLFYYIYTIIKITDMRKLNVNPHPDAKQLLGVKLFLQMGVAQGFVPLPSGDKPNEILFVRIDDKGNITDITSSEIVSPIPPERNN